MVLMKNIMKSLFYEGGSEFMTVLTILLVFTTTWIIYYLIRSFFSPNKNQEKWLQKIQFGKTVGLFTLIFGISGQMLGLYHAFESIHRAGDVSPERIIGGIRLTIIPSLYGIFIYLFILLLWFVARSIIENNTRK